MKNQRQGERMPYFVGEDGRLYYNYPIGFEALIHIRDDIGGYDLKVEIVGCFMQGGGIEYYDIKRNGKLCAYAGAMSANRLKYLLSYYDAEILDEGGERLPLPLLLDEVQSYYRNQEYIRGKAQARAEAIPEYRALQCELYDFARNIGIAEAYEREQEASELRKHRDEVKNKLRALLQAHGIDPEALKAPTCGRCNGKGYNHYGICDCAYAQAETIKAFCAAERLSPLGRMAERIISNRKGVI